MGWLVIVLIVMVMGKLWDKYFCEPMAKPGFNKSVIWLIFPLNPPLEYGDLASTTLREMR
jgi:hypothetical protein